MSVRLKTIEDQKHIFTAQDLEIGQLAIVTSNTYLGAIIQRRTEDIKDGFVHIGNPAGFSGAFNAEVRLLADGEELVYEL